jgi:hypothetical protein
MRGTGCPSVYCSLNTVTLTFYAVVGVQVLLSLLADPILSSISRVSLLYVMTLHNNGYACMVVCRLVTLSVPT